MATALSYDSISRSNVLLFMSTKTTSAASGRTLPIKLASLISIRTGKFRRSVVTIEWFMVTDRLQVQLMFHHGSELLALVIKLASGKNKALHMIETAMNL